MGMEIKKGDLFISKLRDVTYRVRAITTDWEYVLQELDDDGCGIIRYIVETEEQIQRDFFTIKQTEHWRAGENERYYYINQMGGIYSEEDEHTISNTCLYDEYNYYKTEEEAEKVAKIQRALRVLLNDATGWSEDTYSWQVCCDDDSHELELSAYFSTYTPIVFKTKKDAARSIKLHEKEWKIFLGVERTYD